MKKKVALVGAPNVGKSSIFNCLTGNYAVVSNYPGTTVDVKRGQCKLGNRICEIIDTPGMYSLIPLSEEEKVARDILFDEKIDIVVHVIDAKNIARMLPLTIRLIEAGLPVIVNLNIMDEAERAGMAFNIPLLAEILGVPVVATIAARKTGLTNLKQAASHYRPCSAYAMLYNAKIEKAISQICDNIAQKQRCARLTAILLLAGDKTICSKIRRQEPNANRIEQIINDAAKDFEQNLYYVLAEELKTAADKIAAAVVKQLKARHESNFSVTLDKITRQPLTGLPILALVLYFGLYKFVGKFGAGVLVDYCDKYLFAQMLNPSLVNVVNNTVPWEWLRSLIVGDYGIITLGLRYSVAIILPIIGVFFLFFAVIEECGYLPRLAMLLNNLFKAFGLNGRAALPFTLGFGCGTMATMVVRTLETRRERLIATFLLALGIPCSAQLGLVLAILSHNPNIVLTWMGLVIAVFGAAGFLATRVISGKPSYFYMELPTMRVPILANVLTKAYTRMLWYFFEILPVFIIVSVLMWFGDRSGLLSKVIAAITPLTHPLGLPPEFAQIFIFGFFRRDYGAAGLYDMFSSGLLNDHQLLVAAVFLTLFVPCVAQCAVMIKECGVRMAFSMTVLIIMLAFAAGVFVNFSF